MKLLDGKYITNFRYILILRGKYIICNPKKTSKILITTLFFYLFSTIKKK